MPGPLKQIPSFHWRGVLSWPRTWLLELAVQAVISWVNSPLSNHDVSSGCIQHSTTLYSASDCRKFPVTAEKHGFRVVKWHCDTLRKISLLRLSLFGCGLENIFIKGQYRTLGEDCAVPSSKRSSRTLQSLNLEHSQTSKDTFMIWDCTGT